MFSEYCLHVLSCVPICAPIVTAVSTILGGPLNIGRKSEGISKAMGVQYICILNSLRKNISVYGDTLIATGAKLSLLGTLVLTSKGHP